jgi:hypothetical protein
MPPRHQRKTWAIAPGPLLAAGLVVLLAGADRPVHGYIDIPVPSLAELCKDTKYGTEAIAVLRVEKVNREKRGIV